MDRLINVSVAYIPNLKCLEPLENVPVGGGWWWVVCKPILVFSLSLGQAEQFYYFMRLNNQSQMRKDYEQVKNDQNCRVSFSEKSSNGPPFGSFSR